MADQSEANLPPHLDRFWMHCTTHMYVFLMKTIHRKPSVTFSAIPHTEFHSQCKIGAKFFDRYSYQLEKIAKDTWDKLTTSITVNKLNDISRSNSINVESFRPIYFFWITGGELWGEEVNWHLRYVGVYFLLISEYPLTDIRNESVDDLQDDCCERWWEAVIHLFFKDCWHAVGDSLDLGQGENAMMFLQTHVNEFSDIDEDVAMGNYSLPSLAPVFLMRTFLMFHPGNRAISVKMMIWAIETFC